MLKQILVAISSLSLLLIMAISIPVSAQLDPFEQVCSNGVQDSAVCQPQEDPVTGSNGIILRAAQIVSIFVGVAAVIMVIIGGLKYTTSAGDANKVNSAKNTILYAVAGLLLAVLSQSIIIFVIGRL